MLTLKEHRSRNGFQVKVETVATIKTIELVKAPNNRTANTVQLRLTYSCTSSKVRMILECSLHNSNVFDRLQINGCLQCWGLMCCDWLANQSIKPWGAVKHSGERLKCFAWVSQQFAPVDSPYVRLKLDSVFYLHSLEAPSFK